MGRPKEPIICHVDREHYSKGLCESCYRKQELERLKDAIYCLLGNRCSNPNCRWLNADGSLGCTDKRLFHIDHIGGGGRKDRQQNKAPRCYYRKVLKAECKGYRILCAACNWLHLRYEVIE